MSNGGNQELQQEREERELEEAQSELPLWMVAAVPDRYTTARIIDWVEDICSPKKVEGVATPAEKDDEQPRVRPGSVGGQAV
eukprot:3328583-Rhodomonas_salina.1